MFGIQNRYQFSSPSLMPCDDLLEGKGTQEALKKITANRRLSKVAPVLGKHRKVGKEIFR
jgi:hypothetical protein